MDLQCEWLETAEIKGTVVIWCVKWSSWILASGPCSSVLLGAPSDFMSASKPFDLHQYH